MAALASSMSPQEMAAAPSGYGTSALKPPAPLGFDREAGAIELRPSQVLKPKKRVVSRGTSLLLWPRDSGEITGDLPWFTQFYCCIYCLVLLPQDGSTQSLLDDCDSVRLPEVTWGFPSMGFNDYTSAHRNLAWYKFPLWTSLCHVDHFGVPPEVQEAHGYHSTNGGVKTSTNFGGKNAQVGWLS